MLALTLTGSCKKSAYKMEKDNITKAIEQTKLDDNVRWMVILPGLGCNGCIQEAEAFMKEHIADGEILFVLTNISSLKILQQKIGVQIKDCPNVVIDTENEFDVKTDNSIYPCIVELRNGKIVGHEFQSPKNPEAFGRLKNQASRR